MRHAARTTTVPVVRIELRKLVDTRAGRWLFGVMVLLSIGVTASAASGDGTPDLADLLSASAAPFLVVCPLIAVVSATQEWQDQTFLRTFTLVPQRHRVVRAKFAASALLAVSVLGVCWSASLALVVAMDGTWTTQGTSVVGLPLAGVAYVVQGLVFGLLLRHALLAVGVFLIGPVACSSALAAAGLDGLGPYLNLRAGIQPLTESLSLSGEQIWHLAVGLLVWIAVPAVLAIRRTLVSDLD